MTQPVRIQRSRKKGYDMQAASRAINGLPCVSVGRPGPFGNPYEGDGGGKNHEYLAGLYLKYLKRPEQADLVQLIRERLCGKNLACWCGTDQPCHADILLEIANEEEE